ncbi:MAG: DMT family transporter [Bacillota bacterium]
MIKNKQFLGYGAVMLAALLLGGGGAVTKFIYNSGVPPIFLLKIRLVSATVVLFLVLRIFAPRNLKISRSDILQFALLGIVGFSGFIACAMLAVSKISVGLAVFLQYLSPAMIVLFLRFYKKEHFDNIIQLSVILSVCGGLLMIFAQPPTSAGLLGIVLGIASAILYSYNTLKGKAISRKYRPLTTIFYSFAFAALFWLFVPTEINWQLVAIPPLWMYLYVIICYTLLPYGLFYVGVHYLPPANVGVTAATEPVIAAVVAYFTIGESMGLLQVVGGLIVLAATILLQIHEVKKSIKQRHRDKRSYIEPSAGANFYE